MKFLFLSLLLWGMNAHASGFTIPSKASPVPDFLLQIETGVTARAPNGHHFNLEAPMSAKSKPSSLTLVAALKKPNEIRFEWTGSMSEAKRLEQDSVTVEAYLCDDAKTYCIKKTKTVALHQTTAAMPAPSNQVMPKPEASLGREKQRETPKKDQLGFWNDSEAAITEATRTHKPLMIDFFGIWCPPCNLYNETVFNTAKFKAESKNFVLLKIDVDQAESWPLKSRYTIGGYPTIVFVKPNLDEIDRAIGFLPLEEFLARLNEAYTARDTKINERPEHLEKTITQKMDEGQDAAVLDLVEKGLHTKPEDPFLKLTLLSLKAKKTPEILKTSDALSTLTTSWQKRGQLTTAALLNLEDLLASHAESLTQEQILWALDLVETLKSRVDPKTHHLNEMSIADLEALRVDIADATKRPELMKAALRDTIAAYRLLMKSGHLTSSRGLNLELAYYLGKDGQLKAAQAIYERFIKKYPKEFTFYFAAARFYLEMAKDLKRARACADLAVKYAYGDNLLRSMDRLLKVRAAQGEAKSGIEQAREILANVPSYQGLSIRTGRYVAALEKTIDSVKTQNQEPTKK